MRRPRIFGGDDKDREDRYIDYILGAVVYENEGLRRYGETEKAKAWVDEMKAMIVNRLSERSTIKD